MNRFMLLVTCVLTCALVAVPASADDPPKKLTAEERKELEAKWDKLIDRGLEAYQAKQLPDAVKVFSSALEVARLLYPKGDFPNGHANLAETLNNLGQVHQELRQFGEAEGLLKEALAMRKRLHNRDHADLATAINNLALLHQSQRKLDEAEELLRDSLAMTMRLFKGDHPDVARSLNNLALVLRERGKFVEAGSVYTDALAMYKRLFKGDSNELAAAMNNVALFYEAQGNQADSEVLLKDALAMTKRLFKGDHPDVALAMNNLAYHYENHGRIADAGPLYAGALAMCKRLFKGDHLTVAVGTNNLAALLQVQGKLSEAEPLFRDALAMFKRLVKDHPDLATGLNNLAALYQAQGRLGDAEPLLADALAMTRRLYRGDHPEVAQQLSNLGTLKQARGAWREGESLLKDALAMRQRLFKGDHPSLVRSANNLSVLLQLQGKWADAEPLLAGAHGMCKRLFQGDHPDFAAVLNNLAALYRDRAKPVAADALYADALGMYTRLLVAYANQKSEGEALTFAASQPLVRDGLLSLARARGHAAESGYDPAAAYPAVWAAKGTVGRVFEQRHLRARAASADAALVGALARLAEARRRRAELLLAQATRDPATIKQRDADLKKFDETIAGWSKELANQLPTLARVSNLATATPAHLQQALPADTALVDFVRYTFFEFDNTKPVGEKEIQTPRYLGFVVTRDKIAWVDLDTAANIEPAVTAWREAITGGKDIPAAIPGKVRELVWEKVRKELPAGTKTVYVCPDAALCRVPWGALPGDKPGTILLEDFAVATIPHAPFLLDKLWRQDAVKNPPAGVLVVGGVKYDAELAPPAPKADASRSGDPLVKPGANLGWSFLPGTAAEATGVFGAATAKKLPVTALKDEQATTAEVLAALPKARYAHFATHGFFADPSFRGIFQLDEKDYAMSMRGERIGRAANSPLVMTGLVFAGANNPKTPGRGIVTGESLIDLDLSGLELAVLSACETGLGDVAGGEGTFGLQRAFHYAGTTNVVVSLWKVPDESTAALMALFYRNLWDMNLTPMEALRQAQLAIYRNPAKIPELAKGFRGKFEEVPGVVTEVGVKAGKDGKAHPLLWAAFTLSGPGR